MIEKIHSNNIDIECDDFNYYYAMNYNIDNFISSQIQLYEVLINRRLDISNMCDNISYNKYLEEYINEDKLMMYITFKYLEIALSMNDINSTDKYIQLINNYLFSNYDKSLSVNYNNKVIDIDIINKMYHELIKRVRNKKYINWEIVPECISHVKCQSTNKSSMTRMSSEEVERLRKHGQRIKDFYDKSNYIVKLVGRVSYSGYIAYIYPNGKVILDREYNEIYPSTAIGNAIYYMDIEDFEIFSKLDKSELQNNPKVGRIVHQGNWEDRLLEVINKKTGNNLKDTNKILVKMKIL